MGEFVSRVQDEREHSSPAVVEGRRIVMRHSKTTGH